MNWCKCLIMGLGNLEWISPCLAMVKYHQQKYGILKMWLWFDWKHILLGLLLHAILLQAFKPLPNVTNMVLYIPPNKEYVIDGNADEQKIM